jgi:hypothetical protein
MIRAAMLDTTVYEEVEQDKGAIGQAVVVVILSSVAAGVGAVRTGGFARRWWAGSFGLSRRI